MEEVQVSDKRQLWKMSPIAHCQPMIDPFADGNYGKQRSCQKARTTSRCMLTTNFGTTQLGCKMFLNAQLTELSLWHLDVTGYMKSFRKERLSGKMTM